MTGQENPAGFYVLCIVLSKYTDICGEFFARGSGNCVFITNDLYHKFSLN